MSQALGVGESPGAFKTARLEQGLDLGAYLERMRSILRTALEGLFAAQSCHLVVELVVSITCVSTCFLLWKSRVL